MAVVNKIMEKDFIITASDGWTIPKGITQPHPRIYGTFPRKLKKACKKQSELVSVIHSMTGMPAKKFNLKGRGRIATTYCADIAVINPGNIADRATYKAPHQYSEGVTHLLVNGKFAVENGTATGERSGRALRRG
jgi:N-acyl-D-amino-acid deacylase